MSGIIIDENFVNCFTCPITCQIMDDPVMSSDGITYERKAIENWFSKGNKKSPILGTEMIDFSLKTNFTLKSLISLYKDNLKKQANKIDSNISYM